MPPGTEDHGIRKAYPAIPVTHENAPGPAVATKKPISKDCIGLHGLSAGQVPEYHGLRFQVPVLPASPSRVAAPKFQQTCKFKPPQQRARGEHRGMPPGTEDHGVRKAYPAIPGTHEDAPGPVVATKKPISKDCFGLHGLSAGQVPEYHGLRFQVPVLPASPSLAPTAKRGLYNYNRITYPSPGA
jgi:hypothetical protein